ncbi:MAG: hypothetical protein GY832_16745 [Chloroflexi bacterium]|nr:hypothetical protein [Chloroflexota bacterium]
MLETNGGCDLPCWWGVTPGQSEWQTVMDLTETLGGFAFDMPHPDRLFDYIETLELMFLDLFWGNWCVNFHK